MSVARTRLARQEKPQRKPEPEAFISPAPVPNPVPQPSPILAVGSVALDTIETPFGRADRIVGGSGTYFSAAASFFSPVRLVGVVGEDFPLRELDFLAARGVDLGGIEVVKGGKTFWWHGRYAFDLNTRESLATHLNVFERFDPKLPAAWRESGILFLGNIHPALQLKVLDSVKAPRFVLCDTMDFWITGERAALTNVLRRVDALVINDSEARQLAGVPNLVRAASAIREMGPSVLIIKKGEHGALLFTDEGVFSAPAYPLEQVFDPTGAGDTFAGGFLGYLAREWDGTGDPAQDQLRRAVIHGSALASFSVEKFGIERLRDLAAADVARRVEAFRALAQF